MTDNSQTVGAGADAGASDGQSQVSQTPSQPIDGNVVQLLAGLGEKFTSLETQLRGLQGRQDKAENNFRAQLAKLNQYKTQGMSDEEALAEMEADEQTNARWSNLEKRLEDLAGRIAGGGNASGGQQVNAAEVFGKILGQDAIKNPLLAPALAKQYTTVEEAQAAAKQLFYDLSQLPNPNAAQQTSLTGGNVSASNLDALSEEYDRLSVNPAENFERMTQIKQEIDRAVK